MVFCSLFCIIIVSYILTLFEFSCYSLTVGHIETKPQLYACPAPCLYTWGADRVSPAGVKVMVESLPRSESSLLSVKLGGLFLRDLTTQGTIFPVLVSPKTVRCFPFSSHTHIVFSSFPVLPAVTVFF